MTSKPKARNSRKVAIITGGSGGIGRTVARELIRKGFDVALFGMQKSSLAEIAKTLRPEGGRVATIVGDVAIEKDTERAVRNVLRKFKKIDVLVNCAGIQSPIGPFNKCDSAEWRRNLEVNLLGTVNMARAVLHFMLPRRSGVIINFSGGGSTGSRPNFSAYAVAKIGVVKFTEILADEVRDSGIRVNAVAPGAVNTGMLEEVLKAGSLAGDKELRDSKKRAKEGGTPPEKVAELISFLISPKARMITGKLISAVWDDWQKWGESDIAKIASSDVYTLRRKT